MRSKGFFQKEVSTTRIKEEKRAALGPGQRLEEVMGRP